MRGRGGWMEGGRRRGREEEGGESCSNPFLGWDITVDKLRALQIRNTYSGDLSKLEIP
jgi:hypothetical protein